MRDNSTVQVGLPSMGFYGKNLKQSMERAPRRIGVENIKIKLPPPLTRETVDRGSQHGIFFDPPFGEQNLITRAEAMVGMLRFKKKGLKSTLRATRHGGVSFIRRPLVPEPL